MTSLTDGNLNIGATSQSIAGLVGSGNVMGVTGGLLTVTVAASTTYDFSGVISGTGLQFTKSGAGIEVLSGTNTYTGTTTINAGELEVDGKIGPGPVQVNAGGILGGTGTSHPGRPDVKSGGEVDPGTAGGGIGTLNVTNLVFATSSIYHVDTGVSPSGCVTNDKLNGGTISIQAGGTAQLQFAPTFAGFQRRVLRHRAQHVGVWRPIRGGGHFPPVWKAGRSQNRARHLITITYVSGAPGHDVILTVTPGHRCLARAGNRQQPLVHIPRTGAWAMPWPKAGD